MAKYRARQRYVVTVDVQVDAPDWHAANEIAKDLRLSEIVTARVGAEIQSERQFSRQVEPIRPPEPELLEMPEWLSRYPKP